MKLYSNIITLRDIYVCLPDEIHARTEVIKKPRKTLRGFRINLEYIGDNIGKGCGRRRVNSGEHGAGYHYAATWDEHGIWMAALYNLDPGMEISHYKDRADFMAQTAQYIPRGAKAPWLNQEVAA